GNPKTDQDPRGGGPRTAAESGITRAQEDRRKHADYDRQYNSVRHTKWGIEVNLHLRLSRPAVETAPSKFTKCPLRALRVQTAKDKLINAHRQVAFYIFRCDLQAAALIIDNLQCTVNMTVDAVHPAAEEEPAHIGLDRFLGEQRFGRVPPRRFRGCRMVAA